MKLNVTLRAHEITPVVTEPLRGSDTGEKSQPRPRFQRKLWLLFLSLFILMIVGGFYIMTPEPPALGLPGRTALAEAGINFIQNTLRATATSPAFPALAIIVAFGLGGLHALTPGHNKILTGVYLVGAQARFRHALLIGGATAFSHTASVIVIGIMALSTRGQIIATYYLRWLGVPFGLVVVGLGVWLLMRYLQGDGHGHAHHYAHDHPRDHGHGHTHDHAHDHNHPHRHDHATMTGRVTLGGLVTLGLLHGIVPTPDALAVLLVALSVERAILGVALILAYSLGIAGVMTAIGMLFLSSQELLARFRRFDTLSQWVPAIAAVVVILLGLTIIIRTVGL